MALFNLLVRLNLELYSSTTYPSTLHNFNFNSLHTSPVRGGGALHVGHKSQSLSSFSNSVVNGFSHLKFFGQESFGHGSHVLGQAGHPSLSFAFTSPVLQLSGLHF